MANTKAKAPTIYIRGIALFPKLDRPYRWDDASERSVPDPDGEFSVGVIVPEDKASAIQRNVLAFAKEVMGKVPKKVPFKPEVDKETLEETNNIIVTAKQYGKDRDGQLRAIPHFDSAGNALPKDFRLTGGSEVVIKVRPSTYKAQGGGVKLYLDGVQVVKYREPESRNMFAPVEDGEFTYDQGNDNASGNYADEADSADEPEGEAEF